MNFQNLYIYDHADLEAAVREREAVVGEHELLKRRTEALMADYEQEKQVWDPRSCHAHS